MFSESPSLVDTLEPLHTKLGTLLGSSVVAREIALTYATDFRHIRPLV